MLYRCVWLFFVCFTTDAQQTCVRVCVCILHIEKMRFNFELVSLTSEHMFTNVCIPVCRVLLTIIGTDITIVFGRVLEVSQN